jgi:hypothetical protein
VIARERAARRVEVGRRLGLDHPAALATPVAPHVLVDAARSLLDRTGDLAAHVRREETSSIDRASPVDAIRLAVARDAAEGWPPRLSAQWLDRLFGAWSRGARLDVPVLPEAIGASSFARALASFGHALRVAWAPPSMPFALAHEPAFVAAHRLAFVLGALTARESFHRVALGTSRRTALAQSRVLARTLLFEARMLAARALLADDASPAPRDLFEATTARLLGSPLDARLHGAWPHARDDDPARLLALFGAHPLLVDLEERFDLDWFANPRTPAHLRAMAAGPAREPSTDVDLVSEVDALSSAFERSLG